VFSSLGRHQDNGDGLMVFRRRPQRVSDRTDPEGPAVGPGSARASARQAAVRPLVDEAFAAEALSHIDSLYGTALRLTRRPQDAEDLVQDMYLKAFRAADQFERGTNLKAWLFTILHNTFRNRLRSDGRNPVDVNSETVERAAEVAGDEHSPEQLLARATLDVDLQHALDGLPEAFRQAVWLRDVEEFTYAEIANMLNIPIGTVMSRISRGRKMLYDQLAGTRVGPAKVG
jgi:RNA polymerase sigma-70 factor, ECF subfamily